MTLVSCRLLTGLARRLGPAAMESVMYNNKTTSAIIGVVFFDSQTKTARKVHLAVKIQLPK
jgi:hypothetical protein